MSKIGFAGLAALIALVLGMSVSFGTRTAHAEVTDTVTIGCEFLISGIDGNLSDPTVLGTDFTPACDGIDDTDVANLADALGDEDGTLEASDLQDAEDLGGSQIQDGLDQGDCTPLAATSNCRGVIYVFAFTDDDGNVTFDADNGVSVYVSNDGGGMEAAGEVCGNAVDLDCDATTQDDGDGVVVATIEDGSADSGDNIDVEVSQADNASVTSTETVIVTGAPHDVSIENLKDPIQVSGDSSDQTDCEDDSDVSETSQLGDQNRTFVKATVTDADDVELTRASVAFDSDDEDIASIDSDSGEPADDPKATTSISVDAGDVGGVGAFAVICGGTDTGTASITATINSGLATERDDSVDVNVVGEPASVALTASPAAIACDGSQTSTVTATVTDSDGNNVANGTTVNFSVVALGTANPINVGTTDGQASSTITPLSGATAGVTVIVTAGDAQASIRVDCTPGGVPPGQPTSTPTGGVRPPDTGNGGYLGQDSSAGFPMWTLVALALGSVALIAGGLVTRKVSR